MPSVVNEFCAPDVNRIAQRLRAAHLGSLGRERGPGGPRPVRHVGTGQLPSAPQQRQRQRHLVRGSLRVLDALVLIVIIEKTDEVAAGFTM